MGYFQLLLSSSKKLGPNISCFTFVSKSVCICHLSSQELKDAQEPLILCDHIKNHKHQSFQVYIQFKQELILGLNLMKFADQNYQITDKNFSK